MTNPTTSAQSRTGRAMPNPAVAGGVQHSDEYLAYLTSDRWALRRMEALARADHTCQRCGSRSDLEVHHLTYDRLGNELAADLKVVCQPCHVIEDRVRQSSTQTRRRFNGWMRKKYGSDWQWEIDERTKDDEWDLFNDHIEVQS